MADRPRAGMDLDFRFGKQRAPRATGDVDSPFRMLVLGDFAGRASRGERRPLAGTRPLRVDIDNLAAVFAKIAPKLQIQLGDQAPFLLAFKDLDAFHPDPLFSTSDFFAPMRELRRQAQDPRTFAVAAAMVGSVKRAEAPSASDVEAASDDVQRLLGRAPSAAPAAAATSSSVVDGLLRQAVAPHVVAGPDPRQAETIAAVDDMTGELMRAVLHAPQFQRLEALWRGLDALVRGLDLDENLQLFIVDVSREELVQDFAAAPTLADSALYRWVVDDAAEQPWSLIVDAGLYGRSKDDAALLARMGTIAQTVDAAVIAGTDYATWKGGFPSIEDQGAWAALRSSSAGTSLALAAPAVLLRLPYGKETDAVERFAFTEQSIPPSVERYLWGSAALPVAQLIARAYMAAGGWGFAPGDESVLGDLPVHVTRQEGEAVQTPCAQVWLPESTIDAMIKDGMIPLVSARGRGEVRVPRVQSLASPSAALAGRWQSA